jgi:stage II sporulation protein D
LDQNTCAGWKRPALRLLVPPLLLLILIAWVAAFSGCGGKRRVPPPPPPAGQTRPQPPPQPSAQTPKIASKPKTAAARLEDGPNVRVLLKEGTTTVRIGRSSIAPHLTASFEKGRIRLLTGEGAGSRLVDEGSGFRLAAADGEFLEVDGTAYRGFVEVFINPLLVPVVVNELPIEEYLRAVVPVELNPRRFRQMEAIKAQAVAARTFALFHLNAHARRGFDVFADHRSQVYGGRRVEEEGSDRALAETRGIVALYQKKPILALYSSTCGGRTEGYQFLFRQGSFPYLKGGTACPDEGSPFHAWEEKIPAAKVESNLAARGRVGSVRDVKIVKKTAAGRASEIVIQGREGQRTLLGYEIRSVLGLRSNYIVKLSYSRDSRRNIKEITVKGKGWGHGVGMCQFGAVGLASRGFSYERILKRYYQGIELSKIY